MVSDPCITCGGPVGPMSPELRKAKERFGLPLTPPKRCSECVWTSLLAFADAPDEDEATDHQTVGDREERGT